MNEFKDKLYIVTNY